MSRTRPLRKRTGAKLVAIGAPILPPEEVLLRSRLVSEKNAREAVARTNAAQWQVVESRKRAERADWADILNHCQELA